MSDEKEEKPGLEIDDNTIKTLFGLAGIPVPENISNEELMKMANTLKDKMTKLQSQPNAAAEPAQDAAASKQNTTVVNEFLKGGVEQTRPRSVLIVDDLGVIVYQLELLFKKMGFEVTTSNRVSDCIMKFKKKDFGYVIMDLFLPTEKEGFLLLDELKKLVLLCKLDTKIVVMTASSKSDYKINCKNRGADFYIEKTHGWQNELITYCK
ncbi:MAG: response regulator [Candidatus Gastranaerophilales bacterium]|nr:response regulator [Candidatus Gastranaerophilales bacterium]